MYTAQTKTEYQSVHGRQYLEYRTNSYHQTVQELRRNPKRNVIDDEQQRSQAPVQLLTSHDVPILILTLRVYNGNGIMAMTTNTLCSQVP